MHVVASREKLLEKLPRRLPVIVIEVHFPQSLEKGLHTRPLNPEFVRENADEIRLVEGRAEVHLRIDEPDVLQLLDRVRNLPGPVFPAGLDHAVGKAVQGNVKGMSAGTLEPGRQSPELIMMFQDDDPVPRLRQNVRTCQSAKPASDHNDVVGFFDAFKPVFCHTACLGIPHPGQSNPKSLSGEAGSVDGSPAKFLDGPDG